MLSAQALLLLVVVCIIAYIPSAISSWNKTYQHTHSELPKEDNTHFMVDNSPSKKSSGATVFLALIGTIVVLAFVLSHMQGVK